MRYYQQRVVGVLRLLDQLDIIGRTSELARLFGIQFFEVLSRGSQVPFLRGESVLLSIIGLYLLIHILKIFSSSSELNL